MMLIFGQLGFVVSDWLQKFIDSKSQMLNFLKSFINQPQVKTQRSFRLNLFLNEFEKFEGTEMFELATSILVTKCVGDNFKMLATVLAIFGTNIYYLFTLVSGANILSPT